MAALSRFPSRLVLSLKAHRPLSSAAPVYRQLKRSSESIHRWWACESLVAQQEKQMTRIPKQCRSNTCSCGSGKAKSAQYDARGIFLTYTCDDCHDRKMAEFRPDVLTDLSYWTEEPIETIDRSQCEARRMSPPRTDDCKSMPTAEKLRVRI
jgi:hypothetical protein